jgi:hypothetical protein
MDLQNILNTITRGEKLTPFERAHLNSTLFVQRALLMHTVDEMVNELLAAEIEFQDARDRKDYTMIAVLIDRVNEIKGCLLEVANGLEKGGISA